MKKRHIIGCVVLFLILVIPIPTGVYKDGGTRTYSALTYKVVKWRKLIEDGTYEKTRVYFLWDAYRSLDDLWERELPYVNHTFLGEIKEIDGQNLTVEPMEWEEEWNSSQQICFKNEAMEDGEFEVGNLVQVVYKGDIRESNPASINLVSCEIATDLRHIPYLDEWIPDDIAVDEDLKYVNADLVIGKIYSNCFFATPIIPSPVEYKINGELHEDWCVGDRVYITFTNARYDDNAKRMEMDLKTIKESTFELEEGVCYKPVIYLYPEKTMDISVELELNGKLTCTYPAYEKGWNVTANPEGTLTDKNGQIYNYLYWEGETYADYDFSRGFCVKGKDTAKFLEWALEKQGLNRKEANEFIVYWLPLMQENPYNIIAFQSETYTEAAKLNVKPNPDTLIRVFMTWKASDKPIEIKEQILVTPERSGFTVVEWGGTEVIPTYN